MGDLRRAIVVDVARPKGNKKLHFIEPTLVQARNLGNGMGYLKVAMFPGMVGVEVAKRNLARHRGVGENRQSDHRPSREYWGRNRCPSRHEPA
jgi:hypothetical protein